MWQKSVGSGCALVFLASAGLGCERSEHVASQGHFRSEDSGTVPALTPPPSPPPPRPINLPQQPRVAEQAPPPISGGTLLLTRDEATVVAADPDRDALFLVQTLSGDVRRISLSPGDEPGRAVEDADGNLHVVLRGAGAIATIALEPGMLTTVTPVCDHPRGIDYAADSDQLLVACMDGDAVALSAESLDEVWRRPVGDDLRDVMAVPGGWRVSTFRSAELLHLDADGQVMDSRIGPDAVADRAVFPEDGGQSLGPEFEKVVMTPTLAYRTRLGPDGHPIMLHSRAQVNEVPLPSSGGGYAGGAFFPCSSIVEPTMSTFEDGPTRARIPLGAGPFVTDFAVTSHEHDLMAIASPGEWLHGGRTLLVAPLSAGVPEAADHVLPGQCGNFPLGEVDDGQATSVAFDSAGRLFVQLREPAELRIFEPLNEEVNLHWPVSLGPARTIVLSEHSVRDSGHDLFHANVGSGIACVSCHGEATDDGHVWTFEGIGPRRTQSLRGGLSGTEPFHWDGDMLDFDHLVREVMMGRMGGFFIPEEFSHSLIDWLDTQPAYAAHVDSAPLERGREVFEAAGCDACHSGSELTNNETMDVGTGSPLQVPSLRGVAFRAPLMHDGCASDLRERFDADCGGGDQHGTTSNLSEPELSDLLAYLRSL